MKKEERYHISWEYALLVMGSILTLIPLLVTVFSSFKTTEDIMRHFFIFPNPITLSNYTHLLADGIGHYFWNSTVIIIVSVILVTLFIPMATYSTARNISRERAFNTMYSSLILRIFVPFQVIMIPITVMTSRLGPTNIWGLVILCLIYAVPQTLLSCVGYIKLSAPGNLDEAVGIDGADKFTVYREAVFPILKPMYAITSIINALRFWSDLMLSLLVLNKSSESWSLPLLQHNYTGQYLGDYGPSFASYAVGIVAIIIAYLIFQKHIISGMSNGAAK